MPTDIEKVRIECQDIDPALPLLPDSTYEYLLTKNNNSIVRASLDAARIILFQLSQRGDETVDIFTFKGTKSAESYRLALELFLKNPQLNPVLSSAGAYFGGVSKSDILANNQTLDNNVVIPPSSSTFTGFPRSSFEV